MPPIRLLATVLALPLGATAALASSHGNDLVHARKFKGVVYMMNQVHMSLYTYAGDRPGEPRCYDACAEEFPPALLPEGARLGENYSLVRRRDGSWQIAYKGMPLYRYSGDRRPGDMKGDGRDGMWRLARPF